ncbi:hypothetical protein DYB37_012701 [Aphanomyces astaci]|uniref:Uncharacterized protein n=1 Tax=Aphanomyces astaci TaxID=112090 RepID=A0A418FNM5_APHAT|nr:hypothetical protein DYB37_012701 [Aphanomyces astaci]
MQTEESSVIEEIDCGLVLDAVNKVLMRRAYFREKQRSHRRRERDDIHQLRKQAEDLETQAQRLRLRVNPRRMQSRQPHEDSDGGLSWHAIAALFRHETRLTLAENADLVKTLRSHCSLLTRMQLWVAQNDKVPKVMLSDDPAIRKLTKEWATQQMYHNTAAAFQAFPTSFDSNEFSVCDLTVSDLWVNFVDYSQYVWHAPMEVAAYVLRYHLHELLSTRDMSSWTENTVLVQAKLPDGDSAAVVVAHFHEADRCVVVMRQLQSRDILRDDDGVPVRDGQSLVWYIVIVKCIRFDLRRADDGRTIGRVKTLSAMHLKTSGEGSMEAVAMKLGLDLTDVPLPDRDETFRKFCMTKSKESEVQIRSLIRSVLERVQTELTVGS